MFSDREEEKTQEQEIWKDIPGFEELYQVNQWGDIYSLYTNKKIKYSISNNGYKQYNLYKNKKAYIITAHKAVALAFIPNPNNLPLINHKDENKLNCYVENLEWCDYLYNNTYNKRNEKIKAKNLERYGKEFYVYDLSFNLIGKFKGVKKFAKEHNLHSKNFSSALNYNSKNPNNLHQCQGYYPILFPL